METVIVDNAKVLPKGQITIPKDFREALGVDVGDRVTLIKRADEVVMINAAVYAMKVLQEGMKGEFEKAGIMNDDDVVDLVREVRGTLNRAMKSESGVKVGDALATIGRRLELTNHDFEVFERTCNDTPAEPISFE